MVGLQFGVAYNKKLEMISIILLLVCILNIYGIDWGLPSQKRTNLVFPEAKENGNLFKFLKEGGKKDWLDSPEPYVYQSERSKKNWEFPPNRFPHDKPMQSLLRNYLLTTSSEREYSVIAGISSMDPGHLNFNPHFFHYGGCFIYTVGMVLKVASWLDLIRLAPDRISYFNHPDNLRKVYIVGRLVVVFSVTISCLLLYFLGKSLYGKEAGLFAALAFGISPGVVASAHIMNPYLFGVCFILLFLICLLKVKERGSRAWYILSGLSLGLAVGSVVYLVIFLIHFLTCHLLRSVGGGIKGYLHSLKDSNLLFALGSMLLAFFFTNPYYLISFKEVLYEKTYDLSLYSFSLSLENLNRFTFTFFWTTHGLFLSILILLGLFYSLARGRELWFLPLLPIVYFLIASAIIGKGSPRSFRFALSLIPFTSFLAGIAAHNLWVLQRKWIKVFIGLVFTITIFYSLLYSFNFKQDTSENSTFLKAGKWINQNVPKESSIGLMHLFTPSTTPPFDFRRFRIIVYTSGRLCSEKRYFSQYVVSTERIDDLLVPYYQLIQSFSPSWPLSTLGFVDHFAEANRPVFIYKKSIS
jgi:hypothetical protein